MAPKNNPTKGGLNTPASVSVVAESKTAVAVAAPVAAVVATPVTVAPVAAPVATVAVAAPVAATVAATVATAVATPVVATAVAAGKTVSVSARTAEVVRDRSTVVALIAKLRDPEADVARDAASMIGTLPADAQAVESLCE